MELKKLDKQVLKLWYIRAAIWAVAILAICGSVLLILLAADAPAPAFLAVGLSVGIVAVVLLALILLLPYFRYQAFAWGYDEKRIVVKQGVIFRKRVVIPVCQIQDLHRSQGPLMMALHLSDVTISTAGSNFDISTLTTQQADLLIDTLEKHLETRIEETKYEQI